jgi:hypothetical protein
LSRDEWTADEVEVMVAHRWWSRAELSQTSETVWPKRLTENELSDFSRLCHDGCCHAIIEAQDVDRNHSREV